MQRAQTKTDQTKLKTSGNANGSRRYQPGTFPVYDKEYQKQANDSVILNDAKRAKDSRNSGALYGISECKATLRELEGTSNLKGHYKRAGDVYKTLIPSAKEQLQDVHVDFAQYQQEQISNGNALTPPEEWPPNHLQERLKAEALLDIRRAEKTKAEGRIKEIKKKQKQKKKKEMLPEGPVGNTAGGGPSRYDGPVVGIDGQNISRTDAGIPFIDEPDSPYHGMALFDYKKMSKAWKKGNSIDRAGLKKRAKELMAKWKKEAEDAEEENTSSYISDIEMKKILRKNGAWPEKPQWPEDVKPVHEIEEEE